MSKASEERQDAITPAAEPERPANAVGEKAAQFLVNHAGGQITFTYDEEKEVVKRIDRRVLVLLLGAYFFQQLDKSSLR